MMTKDWEQKHLILLGVVEAWWDISTSTWSFRKEILKIIAGMWSKNQTIIFFYLEVMFSRDLLIFLHYLFWTHERKSWTSVRKQVKIIGWSGHTPFSHAGKTQTSEHVCAILLSPSAVWWSFEREHCCAFSMSTVSEHCPFYIILYDMKIVWKFRLKTLVHSSSVNKKLPNVSFC